MRALVALSRIFDMFCRMFRIFFEHSVLGFELSGRSDPEAKTVDDPPSMDAVMGVSTGMEFSTSVDWPMITPSFDMPPKLESRTEVGATSIGYEDKMNDVGSNREFERLLTYMSHRNFQNQ